MTREEQDYGNIPMPNHIFDDLSEWVEEGKLKHVHREFTYAYYWTTAYLWRLTVYQSQKITQKDIKVQLGYHPEEKRINYIIKKNGLLDEAGYTASTKNYPVEWAFDGRGNLEVTMKDDFQDWQQHHLGVDDAPNYFVKAPLIHMGDEWDGLFWYAADSHMMDSDVFYTCMAEEDLGCAGFMLYGLLRMFSDKMTWNKKEKWFKVPNERLMEWTGWSLKKVKRHTTALEKHGMIKKWREKRAVGYVNSYKVTANF